ncbi:hypothetical protein BT96DRAFT_958789 [Gymnopus androsaceus JB14]|uniref:Uncharacterized protein n=1 Tax=Gymnopus androsaceus JB14 TaxID=1447944 RepID=A0A6A4HBI5_9AGAR|nr:hypothetical protein BT96DRAFT_958789 [Gymnopus androsaceus JB14]
MPHKRAKRSVREQQRSAKGADLAPSKQSLSNEPIPKSLSRVLNASKIRESYKKRKMEDGETEGKGGAKKRKLSGKESGKASGILPGESLQHYNKRVEDDMRPLVKNAVQSSLAVARSTKKQEISEKAAKKNALASKKKPGTENDSDDDVSHQSPPPQRSKQTERATEFQSLSSSAPRRLNDIAQAPPELKRLPRGASAAKGSTTSGGKRDGVLSMAQKAMMEQEREKAIAHYRQLKASRRKDNDNDGAVVEY